MTMTITELNHLKKKIVALLERLKVGDKSLNYEKDMQPILNRYWHGLGELTQETSDTIDQVDSLERGDAEVILEELKNLREFALTVNKMVEKYR